MPDNGIALERREAQGSPRTRARAPRDPHPPLELGPGNSACGWADRKARPREPRKLPGASRRSIPSFRGGRKKGYGHPGRPKTKPPGSGALAKWKMLLSVKMQHHRYGTAGITQAREPERASRRADLHQA